MFNACCCNTCIVYQDDFNRASVGADWTVNSGSWSINSNQLYTNANSEIELTAAYTGTTNTRFTAKSTNNANVLRVEFNNDDYLEIKFGASAYIKAGKLTETEVWNKCEGVTLALNTQYTFDIRNGHVYIDEVETFNCHGQFASNADLTFVTSSMAGDVYIDDVAIVVSQTTNADCGFGSECYWFLGAEPDTVTLVLDTCGINDDDTDFSPLDGTYVLEKTDCTEYTLAISKTVTWNPTGANFDRDYNTITLALRNENGLPRFEIKLQDTVTSPNDYSIYLESYYVDTDTPESTCGSTFSVFPYHYRLFGVTQVDLPGMCSAEISY